MREMDSADGRKLIVMRHAKSSWGSPTLPDFDRPLAPRGLVAAPAMGRWLAETGPLPELIVCSPAVRAMQTASLVQRELAAAEPITLATDRRIYEASLSDLLAVIDEHDIGVLMLVGHNPGVLELLAFLTQAGAAATEAIAVPTAAIFILACSGKQRSLKPLSAALVAQMSPRALPRRYRRE